MATVVLTGASGLLGGETARLLAEDGDEVICLGRTAPHVPGATFVEHDLASPLPLSRLPARADGVIHLAQSEKFNGFPEGAADVFAVNIATPAALLDWARGAAVGSFVHASSGGVYGGGAGPIAEDAPVRLEGPLKHYLSTKRAAELLADAYQAQFPVAALRYFFIYGARQRVTMLMPRLVDNVRAGRPLTLQGENGMAFNPVHVTDAARATIAALRKRARGAFNIAGPQTVTIRSVGETIGALLGVTPLFQGAEGRPNDLIADTARMRTELHAPAVSVRDGLAEICG